MKKLKRNNISVSCAQAREADKVILRRYGISTLTLMENAGSAAARLSLSCLNRRLPKVIIVCGKGNNGGDGLVCARHLLSFKVDTGVFLAASPDPASCAGINFRILSKLKKPVMITPGRMKSFKRSLKGCALIVDALLGTGINEPVRGRYAAIIDAINSSGKPVLSLDIPSGLNADSGKPMGCAVRAARTLTFLALKKGMTTAQGRAYCGKITCCGLGVPFEAVLKYLR